MAVALGGPAVGRRGLRRGRHEGTPGRHGPLQQVEFVLPDRRLRAHSRRLVAQPQIHRRAARHALHGHRLGGLDADPPRRAGLRQRPVPALRADGDGLSAEEAGLLGARHRPRRRPRPRVRARLRRRPRRRRRDQPDHRERRHARSVRRVLGRHLHRAPRQHRDRRRPELRPAVARSTTTSSRRRSWTPGRPPRPARTR